VAQPGLGGAPDWGESIDAALKELDYLLSLTGNFLTIALVRADPFLEPIVNDRRFAELAERYRPAAEGAERE